MTRHFVHLLATVLACDLLGCASTGGVSAPETRFRADLGRTNTETMTQQVPRILNRYQYVLYRNEPRQAVWYFETEWRMREPFPDEAAAGFQQASTRIIIEATSTGRQWRVEFQAENRFKRAPGLEWEEAPMTPQFREHIQRVARELEVAFATLG
jgi:hypothetical protein